MLVLAFEEVKEIGSNTLDEGVENGCDCTLLLGVLHPFLINRRWGLESDGTPWMVLVSRKPPRDDVGQLGYFLLEEKLRIELER